MSLNGIGRQIRTSLTAWQDTLLRHLQLQATGITRNIRRISDQRVLIALFCVLMSTYLLGS
jgi:hypothetical protein